MAISTLDDKGQTTIPLPIREALHLRRGQLLKWTLQADGTATVRPQTSALELFATLSTGENFTSPESEREGMMHSVAEAAARECAK